MRTVYLAVLAVLGVSACGGEATQSESLASSILVEASGPAGDNACPNGGVSLDYGIDGNGSGVLDPDEVSDTYVVCHGRDGAVAYDELTGTPELATVALSGDYADLANTPAESDPVFAASMAGAITADDVTAWNRVASFGDHAAAGYLTSESDPAFAASAAASIAPADVANWSSAYGWGDHASAGYLTSESDPTFGASTAATITTADREAWDDATARVARLEGFVQAVTKTVFVTSTSYNGDLLAAAQGAFPACAGVTTGVGGADCICQEVATQAGLAGTYRAWIADNDTTTAPATRFRRSTLPYVLPDLTVIATDWADLTDGVLAAPIDVTEHGAPASGGSMVWTDVRTNGVQFNNTNTCTNWTDTGGPGGAIGYRSSTGSAWTAPGVGLSCSGQAHLYCFEQ